MESVMQRIKNHEGFRDTVYKDTLGKRTVGYGHLCVEDHWEDGRKYTVAELDRIFEQDFHKAENSASKLYKKCVIDKTAKEIIIEMCFQLGPGNVAKFKKMWAALRESPPNYKEASVQMLDSRWAKQTKNRAEGLAETMRNIGV